MIKLLEAWRAEISAQLCEVERELPEGETALRVAQEAAAAARRLLDEINFAIPPRDGMPLAVVRLLEEQGRAARAADGIVTQARGRLENLQWRVDDLRDALAVIERAQRPGPRREPIALHPVVDGREGSARAKVFDPIVFPGGRLPAA